LAWRSLEPRRTKERENSLVLVAEKRWTRPGTSRLKRLLARSSIAERPFPALGAVDEQLVVDRQFDSQIRNVGGDLAAV
jgi:hypothetical protein